MKSASCCLISVTCGNGICSCNQTRYNETITNQEPSMEIRPRGNGNEPIPVKQNVSAGAGGVLSRVCRGNPPGTDDIVLSAVAAARRGIPKNLEASDTPQYTIPLKPQVTSGPDEKSIEHDESAVEESTETSRAVKKDSAQDFKMIILPDKADSPVEYILSGNFKESPIPDSLNMPGWTAPSAGARGPNGAVSIFVAHPEDPAASSNRQVEAILTRFKELSRGAAWGRLTEKGFSAGEEPLSPCLPEDEQAIRKRGNSLASDPARGKKVSPGSIEEAAIAFMAEKSGIMAKPVTRETTGSSEFIDACNRRWDVKSPLSPPPGAPWAMDAAHQLVKIRQEFTSKESVLLNLTRCNEKDTAEIIALLKRELSEDERSRIAVLVIREALPR